MKKYYQQPTADAFNIVFEGAVCLTGGRVGEWGDPGARFDPEEDIYDGGEL